jgi:hypothetical protein
MAMPVVSFACPKGADGATVARSGRLMSCGFQDWLAIEHVFELNM